MVFQLSSSSAALAWRWDELQVQVLAPVPPRDTNMRCQGYELTVGGWGGERWEEGG